MVFQSHPSPRRSFPYFTLIFLLSLSVAGSATNITNLTEQYKLCKTNAEIDTLQKKYGLTRVNAMPTDAALQPGWPQTLIAIFIYAWTAATAVGNPEGTSAIYSRLALFVLLFHWTISFFIASYRGLSAGWVSVNFITGMISPAFAVLELDDTDVSSGFACVAALCSLPSFVLGIIQFTGSMFIILKRWKDSGYGSIAYNITDSHGCIPINGFAFLQEGTRSHAFKIMQTVQFSYAFLVLILFFAIVLSSKDRDEDFVECMKYFLPVMAILISFPILLYEWIISWNGTPVVMSGNCMLVELSPKFGFLGSEIRTAWKYLAFTGGL